MFVSRGKRRVVCLAVALSLVSGTWIPILADGEDDDQNIVKRATYGGNPVVFGDIDTSNSGETGLEIVAEPDDNFIVSVGSINAGDETGIFMSNSGGTVDLTVKGNITACDALFFAEGMDLNGRNYVGVYDANIKAGITGNIVASGGALLLDSYGKSVTDVSVTGNISAVDEAVNAATFGTSSGKVVINGSVTSECDALYIGANENSSHVVSVAGDVSGGECGVFAWSRVSGETDVSVIGTVAGNDSGIHAEAANNGTTIVRVNGDVTSDESGISAKSSYGGSVKVLVEGDLTGDSYGLVAKSIDGESAADILVTGTLTAGRPVRIEPKDLAVESNVCLTAWRIVPKNDDGIIAGRGTETGDWDQDEDFEKAIGYIIRYEQPEEHGTFSAVDADGNILDTSHGFDVANEGDTILIAPDLDEGYEIVAAYNGIDEKTPLSVDEDGNFYLVVPRGGGVYLSVDVDQINCKVQFVDGDENVLQEKELKYGETPTYTGPEPTKKETEGYTYEFDGWDSEFEPVTGDVTYTAQFVEIAKTFTLSFDLNGGALDGKSGKIEVQADYGSTIKLPAAPTRDGYKFLCWKGSQYDASAEYVVQGDHTFTAEWEEVKPEEKPETEINTPAPAEAPVNDTKDTPSPKQEETPTPIPTATPANAKPKTGDSVSGFEWLGKSVLVLGLAVTAFVAVRNIRRKEEKF